jgi:hypothetical protein
MMPSVLSRERQAVHSALSSFYLSAVELESMGALHNQSDDRAAQIRQTFGRLIKRPVVIRVLPLSKPTSRCRDGPTRSAGCMGKVR